MAMNLNVKSVTNIKINENSQNPLLVSKLGINELVEDHCDHIDNEHRYLPISVITPYIWYHDYPGMEGIGHVCQDHDLGQDLLFI